MHDTADSDLIYDWNAATPSPARQVELNDETLRDGLQSPSVRDPTIGEKIEILHHMVALGIDAVDIGLPGASLRQRQDTEALGREIASQRLPIQPNCAARTLVADIEPICDIADAIGTPIEVACFIGSSRIRQVVEAWDLDRLLRHTEEAVRFAVGRGMPVMYVTEDTTRAHPETLRRLYTAAVEAGATRVCVCDTTGHVTPAGAAAVVRFVAKVIADTGATGVKIDWHGHRDRGLAVANTLAALTAGADRAHGTAIGIGERAGNTAMELLLVNCHLLGWIAHELSGLGAYCQAVSRATGVPIPPNYPVIGRDAFRTGTGTHAAAVAKAEARGDEALADRVYSGVPARLVGRRQEIEVGPMSGTSGVEYWLRARGIEPEPAVVERVLAAAKAAHHVLEERDILALLSR